MSEARKYRKFSASQKLELGLASLRGDRSVAEIRREHAISQTLLRRWREQLLEAGAERLAGGAALAPGGAAQEDRSSSSARSGARPTSWRSRESSCPMGSETARRAIP